MAEEATLELETAAALERAQAELDGQPQEAAEEVEPIEPESGVEESAEQDAGETEAEAEVVAEGPSFLMKQEAARAGIDPEFIVSATSDAELERLISFAQRSRDATPAADPVMDEPLKVELPEEEFPADDPMRKALESMVGKINERMETLRRTQGHLAHFANERLEREEREEYQQLYSTFDEQLDSYNSPVFGKAGSLSKSQFDARAAVAPKYLANGATKATAAEEKRRLADLAVAAYRPDLIEQRNQKQTAVTRQAKNVLGGGSGKRPVGPAKTEADILKEWDEVLEGKRTLETLGTT